MSRLMSIVTCSIIASALSVAPAFGDTLLDDGLSTQPATLEQTCDMRSAHCTLLYPVGDGWCVYECDGFLVLKECE